MNFLLHRHLAAAALGTPTAGLGAMLPDVWRMADRRARPSRDVAATQDERVAALLAGIDHHLDADRRFHATEAFTRGERAVAEAVDRAAPSAPRVRLFAHVLWELCLDGELVRREGLTRVLDDVRRGLGEARGALAAAAALHGAVRAPEVEGSAAAFEGRVARLLEEIARGPWIAGYADGAGIAVRLSGVRVRVGLAPLDAEDHERIGCALDELAPLARASVDDILADPGYRQATSRAANRSERCS